jgi:hypothetical protein
MSIWILGFWFVCYMAVGLIGIMIADADDCSLKSILMAVALYVAFAVATVQLFHKILQ